VGDHDAAALCGDGERAVDVSRLDAGAASATVIAPPSLFAVTATLDGTVTVNPTLQSEFAQAGAASVSRPSDTWSVTAGAGPFAGE
jgi:hypothetical protein